MTMTAVGGSEFDRRLRELVQSRGRGRIYSAPMMRLRPFLLLPCLTASLFACDSGKTEAKTEAKKAEAKKAEAKKADVKAEAKVDVKVAEPTKPEVTTAVPEPAAVPPPADPHADLVLDEMKDWYGLKVAEVDGWKPSWEADTVGIQWSKPGQVDVSMALNAKPIEKVEDIESGFMAGTTLSKQDPPTKTAKGWYTIVTTDDGKSQGFIYVRNIGKSWLACDTLVSRSEGDDRPVVPPETLVRICESAEPA